MQTKPQALLILPHLRVQNANAISSPLTWGFPSPTAFTGFVHALHRRMAETYDLSLDGVAIICHHFEAQTSQPAGRRTQVFSLTRNPVDQAGNTAAIVEEGRCHLDISLVIGVSGNDLHAGLDEGEIPEHAQALAGRMRLAGGSVFTPSQQPPELIIWPLDAESSRKQSRKLCRRLLPGFALIHRADVLQNHYLDLQKTQPELSPLEALLDLSRLNFEPDEQGVSEHSEEAAKTAWTIRSRPGWLVPIPVGYAAISPLYSPGEVKNARDKTVPFRFVESVYSLGQWISPHRVEDIRSLLWYHQADPEAGLYCCT
ncbi:MAG: type I-F CRISPR-associated protein Csy2, partial [Candidatus Competibacteraceae bacterium]|nr:type I-F CRISPR-associated protein Csy2 [Candidatus Competibacteraceae bacterium]